MKIKDILNNKEVTLSFEVFPPKTDDKYAAVEKASAEIAAQMFIAMARPLCYNFCMDRLCRNPRRRWRRFQPRRCNMT